MNRAAAEQTPPATPSPKRSSSSRRSASSSSRTHSTASWRSSFHGSPAKATPFTSYNPSPLSKASPSTQVVEDSVSSAEVPQGGSGSPTSIASFNSLGVSKARERLLSLSKGQHPPLRRRDSNLSISSTKSANGLFTMYSEVPEDIADVDVDVESSKTPTEPYIHPDNSLASASAAEVSSPSQPVPIPANPTSSTSRSGWFSSISRNSTRSKGKERAAVIGFTFPSSSPPISSSPKEILTSSPPSTVNAEAESITLLPTPGGTIIPAASANDHPGVHVQPPTPPQPVPSSSSSSPAEPVRRKTWFSSSIERRVSTSRSPTMPSPLRTPTSASSLDEEVPALPNPPTSPPPTNHVKVLSTIHPELSVDSDEEDKPKDPTAESHKGTGPRQRTLSSLNPSTSRFTLALPLFGSNSGSSVSSTSKKDGSKSKDSLVSKKDQADDKDKTIRASHHPTSSIDSSISPAPTNPPPLPEPEPSPAKNEEGAPRPPGASGSWWGYIGWSEGSAPLGQPSVPASTEINQDTPTQEARPAENEPPPELPPPVSPDSNKPERTKSIVSQAGTITSQSAWYTPWTWYASTSTEDVQEPHPGDGERRMTQAEKVKADALRRDRARDEGGDSATRAKDEGKNKESTPQITAGPEINPIASTIGSSTSGWASFFTRSVVGGTVNKAITEGSTVGSGEMEVMDIEEDELSQSNSSGVPPSPTKPKPTADNLNGVTERPASAPPAVDTDKEEKSSKKKKSSPNKKAPLLIVSDEIKATAPVRKQKSNEKSSSQPSSTVPTRSSSPARTKTSASSTPSKQAKTPSAPNLVLPTWSEIFHTLPRVQLPEKEKGRMEKLGGFVKGVLFAGDSEQRKTPQTASEAAGHGEGAERYRSYGLELPRAFDVLERRHRYRGSHLSTRKDVKEGLKQSVAGMALADGSDPLRGCRKAVVIGVHGWFPGAMMRSMFGEPTGTSTKFVTMMVQALDDFQETHGVRFDSVTQIPLEGEGTINKRVDKLYASLTSNKEWMAATHDADVVFIATHSQGSVVSTHLLDRLYRDQHLWTRKSEQVHARRTEAASPEPGKAQKDSNPSQKVSTTFTSADEMNIAPATTSPPQRRKHQRVLCLALCGIHLGPLRYLSTSSAFQGYIQYFENAAAKELFEFQNTENEVSRSYVAALENVLEHETKMIYVASLNDQVVPIYSGLFTTASHPLILRALYIDGDAYNQYDYISNLLVLLIRALNSGIPDSGLLAHLSEATAGSLSGIGHSTAYEEIANFHLAVDYMFLTNEGLNPSPLLSVAPFDAQMEQNDYEIPWSLRDLIADHRVSTFFSEEILGLRDAFKNWHPKTTVLRDLKRKLSPIQRLPPTFHREPSKL